MKTPNPYILKLRAGTAAMRAEVERENAERAALPIVPAGFVASLAIAQAEADFAAHADRWNEAGREALAAYGITAAPALAGRYSVAA